MKSLLTICLLFAIGINLRPVMATIGPLTDSLLATWHLNYSWISLLNGLPILMMGLGALFSNRLLQHYSSRQIVTFALWLIGITTLWRLCSWSPMVMVISAILAGLGIALIQAVFPTIIKSLWPEKTASYMGFYVAAIMGGAAISAALAPQLMHHASMAAALGLWGILALPALWLFWLQVPKRHASQQRADTVSSVPINARFWRLAVFFGLGTSGFTCMLAWLPPHFMDIGYSPTQAGLALSLLSGVEVLSGLFLSQLASRYPDRRPWLIVALSLAIIGLLCLTMHGTMAWIGVILAGCGVGALFPLTLIVSMDHLPDPREAGILTARVQGVGYLLAGTAPMLAGILRDELNSFNLTWYLLAGVFAGLLIMATGFNPKQYARSMS
ncbi:MFS transporter [Methylobacillus gramineus]|uniref:MFS transporter n=1 Tax=Methylobacillus gramineus TaxID=755169 RepID=UPI001CFF5C54|nr:MFS transporter [Methylobacillus gramineus]MCB5184954.1 MFS transporter [Methylobacillus gramineus]